MTKRKIGGYGWREYIAKAQAANRKAREAVSDILTDERIGQARLAFLLAMIANYLGEGMDALRELEEIAKGDSNHGGDDDG